MKFDIDKVNKTASLVFSDDEIEILKKNNNKFTIKAESLPHFRNHFMYIIFELGKMTENILSSGDEEISQEEVTKK
jgi:hypothetical protein|tara:strand:- start:49 stop:276 length:228 start_codon:yes stop_codon:yes gene_type:complete